MAQSLPHLPTALGIHPQFCFNEITTLVMKERTSWSGDDFTVHTADGRDLIRCEGKAMSMSGRKSICNQGMQIKVDANRALPGFVTPQGEVLYTLRKELMSIPKSWYLEDPAGTKFLHIDSHFSVGKAKLDVKFRNAAGDGRDVELKVRGDFFDRSADLTWNGAPVALIRRQFGNARQIFLDHQTYGVEIAPGADVALIAAIVVSLDESQNERH